MSIKFYNPNTYTLEKQEFLFNEKELLISKLENSRELINNLNNQIQEYFNNNQ
jgi:hypothetical protein